MWSTLNLDSVTIPLLPVSLVHNSLIFIEGVYPTTLSVVSYTTTRKISRVMDHELFVSVPLSRLTLLLRE